MRVIQFFYLISTLFLSTSVHAEDSESPWHLRVGGSFGGGLALDGGERGGIDDGVEPENFHGWNTRLEMGRYFGRSWLLGTQLDWDLRKVYTQRGRGMDCPAGCFFSAPPGWVDLSQAGVALLLRHDNLGDRKGPYFQGTLGPVWGEVRTEHPRASQAVVVAGAAFGWRFPLFSKLDLSLETKVRLPLGQERVNEMLYPRPNISASAGIGYRL